MLKGGIKTAHNKSLRKSYKNLDLDSYKIIKLLEEKEVVDRDLYGYKGFYKNAKRNINGAVDWDSMSKKELDIFDILQNRLEKSSSKLSKFSDKQIMQAKTLFNATQYCFSQSF